MKKSLVLLVSFVACLSFQSCTDTKDEVVYHYDSDEIEFLKETLDLPEETYNYTLVTNRPIPGANPDLPFHKATLGRVLFYDKELSIDGSTSCASCHKQSAAFADNEKLSEGLDGQVGTRNSLPLGNTIGFVRYYGTDLTFQSGFFSWDEKFESIDDQSKAAITSSVEMGHSMWELATKIKADKKYQILFDKAYGESAITEANILDAITEFVNSFSSRESKFDKSIPAPPNSFQAADIFVDFDGFSDSENRGKKLFNENCSSCHGSSHNAIVLSSANNGLDMVYADKGRGAKEGEAFLNGVFKVPSLRNIELTGPYMHDGRFSSLEEVVNHYSEGIQDHENLSPFLRNNATQKAIKMNFSDSNKEDIVNYLKTLTDTDFVTAEKWSDPFK